MKLTAAEYARIQDPKLKATIDACGGELPALGGAGGNWQLFVPPQSYTDEVPTGEGFANFPPFMLTGGQNLTPTLMSRWEIGQVYVPVGFYTVNAAAKEKTIVQARLSIFRQGDLVWSQEIQGEMSEPATGGEAYPANVLNTVFAENPTQPIQVNARQTLTMQLGVFFKGSPTYVSRRAYLSQQVGQLSPTISNVPKTLISTPGTLTYDEHNLSGHREL